MRRIALAVMSTISGLVLLFSYHTSLGPSTGSGTGAGTSSDAALAADGSVPAAASSAPTTDGAAAATDGTTATDGAAQQPQDQPQPGSDGSSGTFTGDEAQTKWGPVQVRIVVKKGKITQARAIEYPNGSRKDREINSWAVPQLQDATVRTNSAQIDSLSGATVTSQGYLASLQSALDKAHQ